MSNTENNTSENLHIITSESADLKNQFQSVATVLEKQDLSPEEQKQLAGLEPFDSSPDASLISSKFQYAQNEPNRRDIGDLAIPRTMLVLLGVGAVVMAVLFMFVGFGGSKKGKVLKQVEAEKSEVPEESDRYKAQLAVVDQKSDQKQTTTEANRARADQLEQVNHNSQRQEDLASRRQKPRDEGSKLQPRRTSRQQQVQRSPQFSQAALSRPSLKSSVSEPAIDPQQRWERLAALGTQRFNIEDEVRSADPAALNLDRLSNGEQDSAEATSSQQHFTQPSQPLDTLGTSPQTQPGRIGRVVIGTRSQSAINNGNSTLTSGATGIINKQAGSVSRVPNAYQPASTSGSSFTTFNNTPMTEGARGIINKQRRQLIAHQTTRQTTHVVTLGSSASAVVSTPIVWTEDGSSPTDGRFAVTLTEALLDVNGGIALPKDTVLITEVKEITPDSHVVRQSAIAVVYRDRLGRIRQQEIPPNNLIVRGGNNKHLVAKSQGRSNGSILQQDLLIGALSSLGRIGEIINRPEEELIREDDGFDSYRRERRTTSDEGDILGAALEGFFERSADRLSERSSQTIKRQLARKPVLVVPEGEKATVYVNAFLEVYR